MRIVIIVANRCFIRSKSHSFDKITRNSKYRCILRLPAFFLRKPLKVLLHLFSLIYVSIKFERLSLEAEDLELDSKYNNTVNTI